MPRPISLEISPRALQHNLEVVRQQLAQRAQQLGVSQPKIWAVVKANAYGHGIESAVPAFEAADGLAMLDLDEAIRCRELGWQKPILMLEGFFEPADLAVFDEYRLSSVLHCTDQLEMLAGARLKQPINAWLKLNTGMNRLGFSPAEFHTAWRQTQRLIQNQCLYRVGKMAHFSWADGDEAVTREQQQRFIEVTQGIPGPVSLCNSAATLSPAVWSSVKTEHNQWVRPGVCLYGGSPFSELSADRLGLQAGQTLKAKLLSVRPLAVGETVGYGNTFVAQAPMRMGVVACGYADGYPRLTGNGTPVVVEGKATRLIGRVSMDMLAVDITHIPAAKPGSEVVLWGHGGPSIDAIAAKAQTIGYELMVNVSPRVPRKVISSSTS